MSLHRLSVEGKEVIFVNTWRSTRSGFAHETELYINGYNYSKARCNYINRTWESYAYQTVMLAAVSQLQEAETAREKDHFLRVNGYQKMTKARKAAFEEYLANNENLSFYKKLKEALR